MSTLSVENIREQVRQLAQDDTRFTKKSADAPGAVYSSIWVADMSAPAQPADPWKAVVQGMDSKYYEVSFTIAGDTVTLGTDVKEVPRNVSYEANAHAAASVIENTGAGALPTNLQWMPPGKQVVQPAGFDAPFEMAVTPAIAKDANAKLQQMLAAYAEGKDVEPYIDINHEDRVRAFLPTKFFWGGEDPKTGGIRVEGKWTGAGNKAATNGEQCVISPSWVLHKVTKAYLGVKHNLGGLVPRSAFHSIQAFAKAADSEQPKQTNEHTMTEKEMQDAIAKGIADGLKPFENRIAAIEANAKDDGVLGKRLIALENKDNTVTLANAKATVEEIGVRGGRIGAQDTETIEFWTNSIAANAKAVESLKKMTPNPAFLQIVQNGGAGSAGTGTSGEHEFVAKAKAYGEANKITDATEAQAKFAGTPEGRKLYGEYVKSL